MICTASVATADRSRSTSPRPTTRLSALTVGTLQLRTPLRCSGTATFALVTAAGRTAGTAVADAASQTIRSGLVKQYNDIITQITTTSQDASFNGINLLNGDDLKLTFNETGKSTLNVQGCDLQRGGPWPCFADLGHGLPGQLVR